MICNLSCDRARSSSSKSRATLSIFPLRRPHDAPEDLTEDSSEPFLCQHVSVATSRFYDECQLPGLRKTSFGWHSSVCEFEVTRNTPNILLKFKRLPCVKVRKMEMDKVRSSCVTGILLPTLCFLMEKPGYGESSCAQERALHALLAIRWRSLALQTRW